MPSITSRYETPFALTSRRQDGWGNWSEASTTIPFTYDTIPAGAQVSTATLTIEISAAPAVGNYITVDGQSVRSSTGVKTISITVQPGTARREVAVSFKGGGTAYSSSQVTVAAMTLTFSYVVPMSQWVLTKASVAAGEAIGVTITPASAGSRHRITYALGSKSAAFALAAGVKSHSYVIPMDWCGEIPNAAYGTGTATLQTLDASGAVLGTESKPFTMTVPAGVVPTLESLTVAGVGLHWGLYLQGISSARAVAAGAAGARGSTIRSYAIAGGGYSATSAELVTGPLMTSGENVFRATVTDSRGRVSAARETAIEVTAYAAARLTRADAERCLADGTPDDAGTCLRCVVGYGWTAVGENACLVRVSAREAGAEAWATLYEGVPEDGEALVLGDGGILEGSSWDVLIQAADAITADQVVRKVPTAHTFFLADPVNDAFAFGCYPEGKKRLRLADGWEFYAHGKELAWWMAEHTHGMAGVSGLEARLAELEAGIRRSRLRNVWTGRATKGGSLTLAIDDWEAGAAYMLFIWFNDESLAPAILHDGQSYMYASAVRIWGDTIHMTNAFQMRVSGLTLTIKGATSVPHSANAGHGQINTGNTDPGIVSVWAVRIV